ncbi:MAG: hypothetical protein JXN60_05645 [Lentisphaerae bacterium]|nr:hypothetical protein [Lentisphaerota bacterium]
MNKATSRIQEVKSSADCQFEGNDGQDSVITLTESFSQRMEETDTTPDGDPCYQILWGDNT